jgi:glutamate/tyrosine decarboxylase-like PLP-dependent enzyme
VKSAHRQATSIGRGTLVLMERLDPSPARLREMGAAALDRLVRYYEGLPARRISPAASAREIFDSVQETLPGEGCPFEELLCDVDRLAFDCSRHNGHPRFFGYVASPGAAVASLGDMLASALNTNVTSWRSAPGATEIERVTIEWIKQIVGFSAQGTGLFVSGGSMANLCALAAAREARSGADVAELGMRAAPRALRLYVSSEGHFSISKAASLLGIGRANVCEIPADARLRLDTAALAAAVEADIAAGCQPFCVVANAGTVGTGAFDPLDEIAAVAQRYGLWLHVDASYGGFAALAPSARHFFRNMEAADSVALDPHKWLYLPVDCGCVLYRDPSAAHAAFSSAHAEYIRVLNTDADETFAFWDFGPELSRRFRALNVWMLLKHVGTRTLGEAIEGNMACARYLEELVRASDDFEMLTSVGLSIFCFRYKPAKVAGEAQIDSLNERLLQALQRDGSSYLSNARVGGRFALRGCVLNYRTRPRDMEVLLEDLRRLAARID